MNTIMEYKWIVLFILEVAAWSVTIFMFYARYRMQSDRWFKFSTVVFALTGVIPQVILGVINFIVVKEVDVFTLVIIILLVYGFTLGKKQIKQLDAWAQKKFAMKSDVS
ncbi:hypothetical protein [Pelosinus propionicus]|uniref:hypothetical protein n=1 Tax=Pelosinus propionicus TaxID=380084 RepID=UPI0011137838|nr:hypothetical protein [Pelosinus propionicus]